MPGVCVRGVECLCVRVCVCAALKPVDPVATVDACGNPGGRRDPRVMLGMEPLDPVAPMRAPLANLVSSCFRESMFGK